MEQNNIGLIIKYLRIKKKITQEELAYGICSTSQLYRIEKGKHFPNIVILQDISNKLGEDLTRYTMFSNCTNPVYFASLFNKLENLRLRRHYDKILSLISELEHNSEYNYDINLHSIKQLLGWYRGIAISNINNSDLKVEYYINLLKLTTNFDTIDELFSCILSINDIKIIHSIIATYCRHGDYSMAKSISLSIINNINEFNNPSEISLMPEIYYNLSKLFCVEKDYESSILYATHGINSCISNNNFSRILADLYYILGQCYDMLEEIDNSIKNFNKFICLYDILGHDDFSSKCKCKLLEKYNGRIITLK